MSVALGLGFFPPRCLCFCLRFFRCLCAPEKVLSLLALSIESKPKLPPQVADWILGLSFLGGVKNPSWGSLLLLRVADYFFHYSLSLHHAEGLIE